MLWKWVNQFFGRFRWCVCLIRQQFTSNEELPGTQLTEERGSRYFGLLDSLNFYLVATLLLSLN